MKKKKRIKRSISFDSDTLKSLEILAIKNNTTTSDLVREYVEKGLNIEGYTQDIDLITSVIRQELTAIYDVNDIKKIIEQQIERAIKIQIKAGKMSSSSFFLLAQMISVLYDDLPFDKIAEMVENSTKHGVDYIQLKDFKINDFLFDVNHILEKSDYIDRSNYK